MAGLAAETKCYPASNMTFTYKMKPTAVKSKFCVDTSANFIINQECNKKSDCLAMKRQNVPLSLLNTKSELGSPGHRTCQMLKAVPIIVKYKTTGDWRETSICLFPDDSFINIDYWLKYNINPT
ncbi:MAG: hypothetical protein K0R29_2663 [Pseudobdellovibrio sp.]|jgi:hypothetical protein|nr:hypothetical protein [Pseudobdellovibrio sp.]